VEQRAVGRRDLIADFRTSIARGRFGYISMAHVTRRLPPSNGTQRRGVPESRRSAGRLVGVAGWSLAMMGGCAPEDELPLPPIVWEGESVRVRMDDPAIEVCGGTFEALDRHAQLVREALLLEGDGVIEYSIGDVEYIESVCSHPELSPNGCAAHPDGQVFTRVPYIPHEIVHAARIQDPSSTSLSSAFEEGLATVFGSDPPIDDTIPLDTLGILEDPLVGGPESYYRAGHMVAILLDRHGIDAFRRFDTRARTTEEAQAFLEVFGETKEQFAEVADSVPHCEQSQWWKPLFECDGEPIVADPETGLLTLTGNLDCSEPDVQGPEFGRMWASRHFRLDEPTAVVSYEFEMPDDATLEVVGCSQGCPQRFAYIGERFDVGSVSNGLPGLEPGEYFLRMSRPVDGEGDGRFELVLE
jgi:hypothetical protein